MRIRRRSLLLSAVAILTVAGLAWSTPAAGGTAAIASANTATVLNGCRISFAGRQWRGVDLSGANLRYGVFVNGNFEGAKKAEIDSMAVSPLSASNVYDYC